MATVFSVSGPVWTGSVEPLTPPTEASPRVLVDLGEEFYSWFSLVVSIFVSGGVSGCGVVTNIINIMVFVRQGLRSGVTVLLLALAFTDLACLVLTFWSSVCYALELLDPPNLTFDPISLYVMTAAQPRIIFARLTCWLTAVISVQCCLCVVLPFKSREIITPKVTAVTTSIVSLCIALSYMSLYSFQELQISVDPKNNVTKIFFKVSREKANRTANVLLFVVLPLSNFILVVICTLIMITSLNKSTKWRFNAQIGTGIPDRPKYNFPKFSKISTNCRKSRCHSNDNQTCSCHLNDNTSRYQPDAPNTSPADVKDKKEAKTSKMIVSIMLIFIVCNLPSNLVVAAKNVVPEFNDLGSMKRLYLTSYALGLLLETVNASVNIIAYYHMSSNYKATLDAMLNRER